MSESIPPVSTGSGDEGTTTLLGGGRLAKDDERTDLLFVVTRNANGKVTASRE